MIPPITYFGGKGLLKTKLMPLIPYTQIYAEVCGGGGSVLFERTPSPVEFFNDIDQDLIALFRILQDTAHFEAFIHKLQYTLYSRPEFEEALRLLANPATDPVDRAWATYVRQNQGFCGLPKSKSWGRAIHSSARGMASTTSKWQTRLGLFEAWRDRIARVQIECRPALQVISDLNEPQTTIYVDPPYVATTRKSGSYPHEMSDDDHHALVAALCSFKGSAVVSIYDSPIYSPLEQAGYSRIEFATHCHVANKTRATVHNGSSPRTEVVYRRVRD